MSISLNFNIYVLKIFVLTNVELKNYFDMTVIMKYNKLVNLVSSRNFKVHKNEENAARLYRMTLSLSLSTHKYIQSA